MVIRKGWWPMCLGAQNLSYTFRPVSATLNSCVWDAGTSQSTLNCRGRLAQNIVLTNYPFDRYSSTFITCPKQKRNSTCRYSRKHVANLDSLKLHLICSHMWGVGPSQGSKQASISEGEGNLWLGACPWLLSCPSACWR